MKWGVLALGVAVVMAALGWAVLLTQILPRIDQWRAALTQQATLALGVPVQIGQVVGQAQGLWPMVSLREVRLLDDQQRVALRLPEVTARLAWRSLSPLALWHGDLVLDRLVLVAPELDVRREASGAIRVAGLKLGEAGGGDADLRVADWVLTQSRIEIAHGTVRWTDEFMGAPPLALQQVDLSVQHRFGLGQRLHDLQFKATPPPEFGERFELSGHFTQPLWRVSGQASGAGQALSWWQWPTAHVSHAGDVNLWQGEIHAQLPKVDVQRLRQHVRWAVAVDSGQGALTATVRIDHGRPQGLTLQANVHDVGLRLAPDLPPLRLRRLSGQIELDHGSTQSKMGYQNLAFELDEGLVWPASSAQASWRHKAVALDAVPAVWLDAALGGEGQADRLDLALLARLADRLPLPSTWRQGLTELQVQGVLSKVSGRWEGPLSQPLSHEVKADAHQLSWAASEASGRPGLSHADVSLSANEQGGQAQLAVTQGSISLPGVFELPQIPLDALQATVSWTQAVSRVPGQAARWDVHVKDATLANEDARGQWQADWHTGEGAHRWLGHLSLKGQLNQARADRVWRYLPQVIPKQPRDYVRHALRDGHADVVHFEVDGDLHDFPFKNDVGGRFRIRVPVRQLKLDYVPAELAAGHWPGFTNLDGDLVFEGQRMLIQGAQGRLGGLGSGGFNLHHVQGRIEDLGAADPHLTIQGQGEGLLDDMLRFLSASPIGAWTGQVMGQAQASGRGAMQLALDIPLNRTQATMVKGQVILGDTDDASLRLMPALPAFAALRGSIAFTESSLKVLARTKVWGQEFRVDGQHGADGVTRFAAQGSLTPAALLQAREWPALARLGQRASGETPVQVNVLAAKGRQEVQVSSSLQGLALQLPSPMAKSASTAWPFKLVHRSESGVPQDTLSVELGNPLPAAGVLPWVKADLRMAASPRAGTASAGPQVARGVVNVMQGGGGVSLSAPLAMPVRGWAVQAQVPGVDLDAWLAAWRSTSPPAPLGANGAAGRNLALGSEADWPDAVVLKAGALTVQGRTLKELSASVTHPSAGQLRVQLDSPQVAGTVDWWAEASAPSAAERSGRVVARLSHLSVPAADAQSLTEQAAAQMLGNEQASVPALDIVIEQFEWRGLPLGRIEVEAINRQVPVQGGAPLPEWRLTKFRINNPDAQFSATGNWAALGAQSATRRAAGPLRPRTALAFTLDLRNSGDLLNRLGQAQTLKGGKGAISGQVSWLGSPLEPDTATLAGDMSVLINEGQFLKADPGIAKLLGVLSLQSLPRRLLLDFRDVFQQGFAFDRIDGDVKVGQGVAITRNLRMRGVQAVVLMEGQADLVRETQNLQVFVVPDVNMGGASLAYAAINPVVGLGTFLAQVLLRKQVTEANTQAFRVTGPWADPLVERVPFKAEAGASPAEPASTGKSHKPS